MSEATPPESNQPIDPNASAWYAQWDNFSPDLMNQQLEQVATAEDASLAEDEWQDWQPVDFPNATRIDAIAQAPDPSTSPLNWAGSAIPTPAIATPTQTATSSASQPSMNELISLIQELNQCNSALLDRVSQLEEALEQRQQQLATQQTLQPLVGDLQDLSSQDQIVHLVSQLEQFQQTNHNQQLLIDTLRHQLRTSQERTAQLERECATLQDQHLEQAQYLLHSENTCRDLHQRLQRQQRYTLQYKAALEKCLDAPAVNYEEAEVISPLVAQSWYDTPAPLTPAPLLPKVQRIQPWTAQSQPMVGKLEAFIHAPTALDSEFTDVLDTDVDFGSDIGQEAIASMDTVPAPTPVTEFPAHLTSPATRDVSEAGVPPITPSSGDAPEADFSALAPEAIQVGLSELRAALGHLWSADHTAATPPASEETEATLWQNLARLIDVSTDDVLKASNAQEFAAFEAIAPLPDSPLPDSPLPDSPLRDSIELAPAEPSSTPDSASLHDSPLTPPQRSNSERALHLPIASTVKATSPAHQPCSPAEHASVAQAMTALSTPPSPLLYPTRPLKKRESLAAVELPTFPR